MKKIGRLLLVLILMISVNACKDDEPPLPDNLASFESAEKGITDTEVEIKINLSRAAEAATAISVSLTPSSVAYDTDFITTPAATNNTIALSVPAGQSSVSFKVTKKAGVLFDGDENIVFKLASVASPVLIGTPAELKLSFGAIISTGTTIQLNGIAAGEAGSSAANSVFLDLSGNTQTPVLRDSWDLGLYSGTDFRVIINNTNAASAFMVDKADINAVSDKDLDVDTLAVGQGSGTLALVDDYTGDLSKTVIKEISATDGDNKVYVINRKGGNANVLPVDQLYKIRVLRKGSGYTLQYAKLNDTIFKTVDITKDATGNFKYFAFAKEAEVAVEPLKARWDIEWGYSMYYTNFGTGLIPYGFSDLVFINKHANVQAAEVLTSVVSYDAFAESNIAALTLSSDRDVIGSKWRTTSPAASAAVKTDRFYVIKDGAGNVYKLRFVSFIANDGGERGKPKIEYALVKKGA